MNTAFCPKNRLSLLPVRLVVRVALLLLVLLPAGQLNGAERAVYQSNVLTFQGRELPTDALTSNSFLVSLDSKAAVPEQNPPKYHFILRGLDPVEKALLQDIQNGQWKDFDLFRAAMIIEEIRDPALIRTFEARLDALVANVLSALRVKGDTSQRTLTRSLFEAMHREILTQPYSLDCTELSKVMQTGHFNCVSATVLFNCLAEKAGLNVCALEMPGHALSRVKFTDGVVMNLETTCPTWFDLQSDQERHLATLRNVAPAPASPKPLTAQNIAAPPDVVSEAELSSNLREISPVQLAATIYYNLGVDLLTKERHEEAMAANIKALYLDRQNEQAWANLLAAINNWALAAASDQGGKRYDIAITLLDGGVLLDPAYPNFRSNQTFVFYQWISGLAKQGEFDKARMVYAHANLRIPNDKALQNYMNIVNQEAAKVNR